MHVPDDGTRSAASWCLWASTSPVESITTRVDPKKTLIGESPRRRMLSLDAITLGASEPPNGQFWLLVRLVMHGPRPCDCSVTAGHVALPVPRLGTPRPTTERLPERKRANKITSGRCRFVCPRPKISSDRSHANANVARTGSGDRPTREIPYVLHLKSATSPDWLRQVEAHLEEVLIDHAHCEKKAAGTAMNLLFAYVENGDLCREMTRIVSEELEHFHMVLEVLAERNIRFRRLKPSRYGRELNDLADRQEPLRAVDRLLVAGLIEARSCERFGIIRDAMSDRALADFYGGLFESEARHHATYLHLARQFAPAEVVEARLERLAQQESEIIARGDPLPRMHS